MFAPVWSSRAKQYSQSASLRRGSVEGGGRIVGQVLLHRHSPVHPQNKSVQSVERSDSNRKEPFQISRRTGVRVLVSQYLIYYLSDPIVE